MSAGRAKRVLVTGGLGFMGFHLAVRLSREPGTDLVIVDDLRRGRVDQDAKALLSGANVRFLQRDLTEPASFAELGSGFDEVYHCAAVVGVRNVVDRPDIVLRVNALSLIFLLDWYVRGGGERLLFPSSSEAYAWTQRWHPLPVPTPEEVPLSVAELANPRVSYAASKMFGELAVTQYCRQHDKHFAIVRYHNVYGPRMGTQHVIPELYWRAIVQRQNPLIVYSIDHRRAFCYVDDAVAATIAALRSPEATGRTLNIGNDREEITIGGLARTLLEVSGVDARLEGCEAPNDPVDRRCPDLTKARRLLGCEPTVTLANGLRRTVAWYEPFFRAQA